MLPLKEDNPNGLYQRYVIRKVVKARIDRFHGVRLVTKAVDKDAEYFVLRLDLNGSDPHHILACRKAIQAYAREIEATVPGLAKDLRERYPVHALSNLLGD